MFQPFTGNARGDSEQIIIEFNTLLARSPQPSLGLIQRESVVDLEQACHTLVPEELAKRLRAAAGFFEDRHIRRMSSEFRPLWERALCRHWNHKQCDPHWNVVLDAFYGAVQTTPNCREQTEKVWPRAATGLTYRILFPTAPGDGTSQGWIVWAIIRVVNRHDDESILELVPWSEFLWAEGGLEDRQANLTRALPAALIAAGISAREVEQSRFLIEFASVRVGEINSPWPVPATVDRVGLNELYPLTHRIDGNSLDLAVAIAAWAAHSRSTVVPLVATGRLADDATVQSVGNIQSKLLAFQRLRELIPEWDDIRMLVPMDADTTDFQNLGIERVGSFDEIVQHGFLSDGFDRHCQKCGAVSYPVGKDADSKTLSIDDDHIDPLNELLESGGLADLKCVSLPFNENAEPIALRFADRFTAREYIQDKSNPLSRKIAFPISLKWLLDAERANSPNWTDLLLKEIQRQYNDPTRLNREAVSIALRKTDKLVLVAYDEPSCSLWNRLGKGENMERYRQCIAQLRRLSTPQAAELGNRLAQQRLLVICSDRRHELLWAESSNTKQ